MDITIYSRSKSVGKALEQVAALFIGTPRLIDSPQPISGHLIAYCTGSKEIMDVTAMMDQHPSLRTVAIYGGSTIRKRELIESILAKKHIERYEVSSAISAIVAVMERDL